jgi:predicted lipoprotein with Yx(FWY)xxD motif
MNKRAFAAAIALTALLAACGSSKSSTTAGTSAGTTGAPTATTGAGADLTVTTGTAAKVGTVLVVAQTKRTLYMFDPENAGKIVCTGGCTSLWPPLIATGPVTGPSDVPGLATVSRPDGATQVTFNGHPLYTYANDKAAGDANGDGVGGAWHAAKPGAGSSTATTAGGGYTYG